LQRSESHPSSDHSREEIPTFNLDLKNISRGHNIQLCILSPYFNICSSNSKERESLLKPKHKHERRTSPSATHMIYLFYTTISKSEEQAAVPVKGLQVSIYPKTTLIQSLVYPFSAKSSSSRLSH
jgi:hypothetical protein